MRTRSPVQAKAYVVRVQVSRHPTRVRGKDGVETVGTGFSGGQHIVEAMDLVLRGERERPAIFAHRQSHAPSEGAFEYRQVAILPYTKQEQLTRLIRGESDRAA